MHLKKLIPAILGLMVLASSAWPQQLTRGNLTMGISASLNSVKLVRDSVKYGSALLPGVGISLYSNIMDRVQVNYGAQFAMKGTNDYDTLGDLRTFNLEPFAALQFKPLEGIFLEGGALYSYLVLAQTVKISGEASSGKKRTEIDGFKSSFEFFAGLQINLSNKSRFGIRYYIPYSGTEFRRLEFRLIMIMLEGYPKR